MEASLVQVLEAQRGAVLAPWEARRWKARCRVIVWGYGLSGAAVVEALSATALELAVYADRRPETLSPRVRWLASKAEMWAACDAQSVLVVSPGIDVAPWRALLEARGCIVSTELELALAGARARTALVTGTNGKSTVATWLAALVGAAGSEVFLGGNVGRPAIELWDQPADVAVIEASSYQLAYAPQLRAAATVITGLSEDHLSRHGTMTGYARAKLQAVLALDAARPVVLGSDAPETVAWLRAAGRPLWLVQPYAERIARAELGEYSEALRRFVRPGLSALRVRNGLTAWLGLCALGLDGEAALEALARPPELPHRFQIVAASGQLRFIDDSKATNEEAVRAALAALPEQGAVTLIMGGQEKGEPLEALIVALRARGARVILLGDGAPRLEAALRAAALVEGMADSMPQAVALAAACLGEAGVVLLSPACASFDRYASFAARGLDFQAAVEAWRAAASGPKA